MGHRIAPDQFLVHVGFPGQPLDILVLAEADEILADVVPALRIVVLPVALVVPIIMEKFVVVSVVM
jgi:hypothetical protein